MEQRQVSLKKKTKTEKKKQPKPEQVRCAPCPLLHLAGGNVKWFRNYGKQVFSFLMLKQPHSPPISLLCV